MATISITLPDNSSRELPDGSTVYDLAALIGAGLAKAALAGKINGLLVDLSSRLANGDRSVLISN